MKYEPIFKGEWPNTADNRWTLIRRFLSVWCFGQPNQCLQQPERSSPFISKIQRWPKDVISPSLHHWSDVVENYSGEHLVIRDTTEVSDLSSHMEVPSGEFTVLLMQGEADVFWTVKNDSLSDDDPQVFVFQDYAPDSPPLLGTYSSTSNFALWYFCLYNNIGKSRSDVFSCDLSGEAYREICDWFPHRLMVQPSNPFCSSLEIMEATNFVGIREKNRLTCSLFADQSELTLPSVLSEALKEEHHRRKEFQKRFHN